MVSIHSYHYPLIVIYADDVIIIGIDASWGPLAGTAM